ncbi:uncharacterized protein METZ01_LOCUS69986 [marine metagenome]|uniref:Uncharacterized protein n=1 Tax=marine metagenome TaxID=408172 RepID=A0A381TM27_9ZZZZ
MKGKSLKPFIMVAASLLLNGFQILYSVPLILTSFSL